MKKLTTILFYLLACAAFTSCLHNDHDISITFQDSEHEYSMKAYFPKSRTRDVAEYMNSSIGRKNNISFTNTQTDATLTLDDHTKFYIKKNPGFLEIKFNKDQNSDQSFEEIKSMCQGIKKELAH